MQDTKPPTKAQAPAIFPEIPGEAEDDRKARLRAWKRQQKAIADRRRATPIIRQNRGRFIGAILERKND